MKRPRPQVAGLTKGVGGIWLWMGGEEREERIQNTEFRMSNDEVRLAAVWGRGNKEFGQIPPLAALGRNDEGGRNKTVYDCGGAIYNWGVIQRYCQPM